MINNQQPISLLSESRRRLEIKDPSGKRWFLTGLGVVLLVGLIWGGSRFYRQRLWKELEQLNEQIVALEKARDKKFEKELLTLDRQFSLASNLLDQHFVWSKALAKIQNLTPTKVQFSSFLANATENQIRIKAYASDYLVIAKHVASLLSDKERAFKEVNLTRISNSSLGLLEYEMEVIFDTQRFLIFSDNQKTDQKTPSGV